MDQHLPGKTCPECGSAEYTFRSCNRVGPEPGQQGEEAIETKYRCKACSHEWRVRVPLTGAG